MSKKGLNKVDEFVGGHLSKNAISVIVHGVRKPFQSFNIKTKIAKVDKAGIQVGVFIEQVVDVIIRCSWSGDGREGNRRVSMRVGGKGTSGISARHSIRTFRLF